MFSLVVVTALLGYCSAVPQSYQRSISYNPGGSTNTKVAYEFHDVHQSPVPAIRQTHSSDQVPVQYQPQFQPQKISHARYLQDQPVRARSSPPYRPPVAILSMNQETTYDGNFNYGFKSEDGTRAQAVGSVRSIEGSEFPAQVMRGSYAYTAPDGTQVVTDWYADETGFHAQGDHIPAVPEAIQRSVEYLRSLPPVEEEPQRRKLY